MFSLSVCLSHIASLPLNFILTPPLYYNYFHSHFPYNCNGGKGSPRTGIQRTRQEETHKMFTLHLLLRRCPHRNRHRFCVDHLKNPIPQIPPDLRHLRLLQLLRRGASVLQHNNDRPTQRQEHEFRPLQIPRL